MADESTDPLTAFLIESAAVRALPNLQAALADADARFNGDPSQAAVSALLAVADFLSLTCEPGVTGLPALPGAGIFEALADDLRALDEGRASGLLAPRANAGRPALDSVEVSIRIHAAVAVECRHLRLGGRGKLDEACQKIATETKKALPGVDAATLKRWRKELTSKAAAPDGFEGRRDLYRNAMQAAHPRFFADAAKAKQEREQARADLEREALESIRLLVR
jgi:hypothetical protein